MKRLLPFLCTIFFSVNALAQLPYNFSVLQQAYQPLGAATQINTGTWDDTSFVIPLGFNFKYGSATTDKLYLVSNKVGWFIGTDTTNVAIGFVGLDADLQDRGALAGTASLSPIRYQVEGTAGSRIFKIEFYNAGFYNELLAYNTMNDSVCFQAWLYEGTNVAELRYGPSYVFNPQDYFLFGDGPLIGFSEGIDIVNVSLPDPAYVLQGNPTSPTIITISNTTLPSFALDNFPPNGTVYRFEPKSVGVANTNIPDGVMVYPTVCQGELYIDNKGTEGWSYSIISMTGSLLYKGKELHSGLNNIDIRELAPGMYMIKLTNGTSSTGYRFIRH